jgi:hypothetical protein
MTWPSGEVNVFSGSVSRVKSFPGLAALAGATARLNSTTNPVLSNQLAAMTVSCRQIRSLD